jgi:mRNA-degrading endonuclease RelE of RelBE toxin-antitoxin system
MEFRIADTFTDSLARLAGDEQKAVKTTAFDLQLNPAQPGMSFHKLDKARDKNFWSVRVNADVRLIVHKTPGSLLLCYVGHHDQAYAWAESAMFSRLARYFGDGQAAPFDFAVVDEAQDLSVSQMRFLAALGGGRPNALFFAGDLGQRIFQQPFSWKSLGVDIRGRSRTLRVNYRTSHQIRAQADRLLGPALADVDGVSEDRGDTVSVVSVYDKKMRDKKIKGRRARDDLQFALSRDRLLGPTLSAIFLSHIFLSFLFVAETAGSLASAG